MFLLLYGNIALLEAEISLSPEIELGLEDEMDIAVKSLTTNVEKSDENNNGDFDLSTELGGEKGCEKVLSADVSQTEQTRLGNVTMYYLEV